MFQSFHKNMQRMVSGIADRVSNKSRKQKARVQRARCGMQIEPLEKRQMMAVESLQFVGTRLVVNADDLATTVHVRQTEASISVHDIGANRQWNYPVSQVHQVEFRGGDGDDTFINYARNLPVRAFGGRGNDYLEGFHGNDVLVGGRGNDVLKGFGGNDVIRGGKGNDKLYGMDGHDTLKGQSGADLLVGGNGNDTLYGGSGRDELFGDNGDDGLFGGVGDADRLTGGDGEDRFLVNSERRATSNKMWSPNPSKPSTIEVVEDVVMDRAAGDSVTHFFNMPPKNYMIPDLGKVSFGAGTWSDADIEKVDKALRSLHRLTGNTRLLKTASGSDQKFERAGIQSGLQDVSIGGWNQDGVISLTGSANLIMTTYHEIAHNWDEPAENRFIESFRALSGWQQTGGVGLSRASGSSGWYYRDGSEFARSYGRFDPLEDFATTWESYFNRRWHGNQFPFYQNFVPAKHAALDRFFASLRG
jgi:hypothetical protein